MGQTVKAANQLSISLGYLFGWAMQEDEMLASISKTSSASSSHRNECIVIPDSPPRQPQKIFSVPWLDHQDMTLKRLSREADGKMIEESAEMLEGDNGFVFGKFKNEDYIIETEIPNLTRAKGQEVKKVPLSMEPAVKKGQAKAKAKAKAKASAKAAAAEEDKASSDLEPMDAEKENSAEEETAAEAAAVPSPAVDVKYGTMFYKTSTKRKIASYAVRREADFQCSAETFKPSTRPENCERPAGKVGSRDP